MLHSAVEILEKQRQMAIAFDLPIIWGTDSHPDGRTLSVARDAGVPAIYLEFGGGTGVRPRVVQAYKEGFIKVLESIGMIVNQKVTVSAVGRFWVEDHRRDSGYLQGKMPAPADGIFVSAVTLGEVIEEGQLWGTIIDPFTGISTAVLADLAGLVFLERKLVKVKKGDALGGILPIEKPGKKIIYA
jgi:predicted deacylase